MAQKPKWAQEALLSATGRVGTEPEYQHTRSGTPSMRFRMGVTPRVKKGDQWVNGDSTWFDVTIYGGKATPAAGIEKGDLVHVDGRLSMEEWQTREGEKRQSLTVRGGDIELIEKKGGKSVDLRQHAPVEEDLDDFPDELDDEDDDLPF